MTSLGRDAACLSSLLCDQWLNGELDDDELTAHLATCQRCAARLVAHQRERVMFAVPLRGARRKRKHAVWIAIAAAAALALWIVLPPDSRDGDAHRIKGKPAIGFYVKHGDAVRKGGNGEVVFPEDALNFTASTDRPTHLAIISIDGAHTPSVYYPDGPSAAYLPAGREQLLPLSVVLDDVLGTEQIHGVFCDRAIAVVDLEAALAGGGRAPAGCVVDTLTIEKRRAP